MESREFVDRVIEICDDRQAESILCYDVRKTSILTDYYVICTGNSDTHLRALMTTIDRSFRDIGVPPRNIDGIPMSHWIVMDYSDVLIHIFNAETRAHYQIEALLDEATLIHGEPVTIDETT
jgi:ribosome-associated protein